MRFTAEMKWLSVLGAGGLLLLGTWGLRAFAQNQSKPAPEAPKTAAQQYKNIQVLKDIPADQLIPTMQFIAASLGVECDFCHVEHEMQKDDKKPKQIARKMIEMELAINKGHFKNEIEVTCYTCHRGSEHPVGTPILPAEAMKPASGEHEEGEEAQVKLPSADQILDKYLAAVGGPTALMKIKTRVQKGTLQAGGMEYPIEVYSEAPDKRISISHPQGGSSVTAFNGEVGWLSIRNGVHRMTQQEREAARIDAELYFPAKLRELYKDFKVKPGEAIDGHATYLVMAQATNLPQLQLYFDQSSGLLLRLMRFAQTPLGQNPTQIDYADYRVTDDLKIPYQWTLTRPNGSFTIKVDQVQTNVPIDPKLFVPPSDEKGQ
ncbi:MAG TPA: c-type cytochrome [Candidatus Sulfotelmatobacter sp.]|nr:c-type cytochrome [Candidatus Sulfotelmatobacter sp.]